MLTDRRMEVDAILGNAVKIADRLRMGDGFARLKLLAALTTKVGKLSQSKHGIVANSSALTLHIEIHF